MAAGDISFNLGDKVRRFRTERNLTLKDVAESTGFSKALISRIEHNLVSPPIATLWRISRALNVPMTDFFAEEPVTEALQVVRAAERSRAWRDGSRFGYRYESLAADTSVPGFEPLLVTLAPEERSREHLFGHAGHEFILVLKGKMRLHYGDRDLVLSAGDSVFFNARVAHRGTCHGKSPVTALSIRLTDGRKRPGAPARERLS